MLKKFFITVLGTITGLWVSALLLMVVLFGIMGALFSVSGSVTVNDNSILYLDLSGDITERTSEQSLVDVLESLGTSGPTYIDMLHSIERAANDNKIKGIYINCGGSSMGTAQREEIVNALLAFKRSGKWIYAYGDTYSQGDYLIASVADKVYLNPVGSVDIHGIGTLTPFFTGLLDKLGIKVQVIKVGSFKSAVEPFILTQMSDSSRLQTRQFVDTIWNYYASTVAQNRSVASGAVAGWADSLIQTYPARRLPEMSAVTALKYRREVEAELRKLVKCDDDDDLPLVKPAEYMAFYSDETAKTDDDHLAILFANGDISDNGKDGIVGATMAPQIIKLADDKHVRGMVLRVNSGGGSAFASEQIWEALEYFKSKNKPLYVSMGDYAASGGYYISCGADKIWADRTTITGSIGVFGMIPDLSGLVSGKLGVNFDTVASGPNATFMNVTSPMTAQQSAAMQRFVENIYSTFVERVATGRNLDESFVRRIAEGRVWVGPAALRLGLVDEIGGLDDAVKAAITACKLPAGKYIEYPQIEPNLFAEWLHNNDMLKSSLQTSIATIGREATRELVFVEWLRGLAPVQARMERITIE